MTHDVDDCGINWSQTWRGILRPAHPSHQSEDVVIDSFKHILVWCGHDQDKQEQNKIRWWYRHVFDQLIKSKRSVPPESTLLFQLSQQQHNMKFGNVAFLVVNSAAILHRGSAVETSVAEPDSWADVSNGLEDDGGDSFDYDGSFEVRILY